MGGLTRLTPGIYTCEARAIVVALEPGDLITFRESGRRRKWSLPLDRMFRLAVRETARAERRAGAR